MPNRIFITLNYDFVFRYYSCNVGLDLLIIPSLICLPVLLCYITQIITIILRYNLYISWYLLEGEWC